MRRRQGRRRRPSHAATRAWATCTARGVGADSVLAARYLYGLRLHPCGARVRRPSRPHQPRSIFSVAGELPVHDWLVAPEDGEGPRPVLGFDCQVGELRFQAFLGNGAGLVEHTQADDNVKKMKVANNYKPAMRQRPKWDFSGELKVRGIAVFLGQVVKVCTGVLPFSLS